MLYELEPSNYSQVEPLFKRLDEHLVLASILAGTTPTKILVDRLVEPQTAFTGFHARMFLLGSPHNPAFNQDLRSYLIDEAIPQAQAQDRGAFIFHLDSDAWLPQLEQILAGRFPLERKRQFYTCTPNRHNLDNLLPPAFQLQRVSPQLLNRPNLEHKELLLEELCSERTSMEDFLANSFGFVILHGDELAGWCLSEYNHAGRCEVGVATLEKYQRQGLGTAGTLALLDHAARQGYRRVGWHCWSDNLPSAALARRAGFELIHESTVYLCMFDLSLQLALHALAYHRKGELEQAHAWYERALAEEGAQAWVFYNLACCQAQLGDKVQALGNLQQAIEAGYGPLEAIRSDPDLVPLQAEPGWQKLVFER